MKEGWVSKKIKEVCVIRPPKKEATDKISENDLVSFVPMEDLGVSQKYLSPTKAKKISEVGGSYTYFSNGDVLLAKVTPCFENGKLGIAQDLINNVGFGSSEYVVYRPNSELLSEFLYYFLSQDSVRRAGKKSMGGAVGLQRIQKSFYEEMMISYPSLSEQRKIIAVLDEVFARLDKAKANVEKNLKNVEELFQSRLNEIFSGNRENWIQSTIGNECELMTGGTPSKSHEEYFKDGRINWLVSGDIHKKIITECDGKITEEGLENSNAKYLPLNSVMIALNGQGKTRGTVALLKIKATCNQSLVSIYPKDDSKLLPEYIYENLNSRYKELRKLTSDDDNDRRGLNMPILRKIKLSYPKDIDEQKKIVSSLQQYTAQLNKLSEIYLCRIASLEELRKSILEKAFRGELI